MRLNRPDKPEAGDTSATARDCRRAALDLLARREHARRELATKLRARGFASETIESVLTVLAAERLLDEARFAESFVTARAGRGQGPARIRAELAERGVAAESIEQALGESGVDWQALLEQVRRRRFGAGGPRDFRDKARQMRFLHYRGFTTEQILRVLHDADDPDGPGE